MRIAVVGATGLVGSVMLKVLEERGFENEEIIVAASQKSVGKELDFAGRKLKVISPSEAVEMNCDFAIFSAGSKVSKEFAPKFASHNTIVIDNSSCWRMDENVPLVVPEINIDAVKPSDRIIANPNCSTIQMVMALAPLDRAYNIKRLVISTYQSVTGTGVKAVSQLNMEEQGLDCEKAYFHPIYRNVLPYGGDMTDDGYTTEEIKLVKETQKILNKHINITATVARVPVCGGHSESVNIEFEKSFELEDVRRLLIEFSGVEVMDEPKKNIYPMPIISQGKDEVFVGRIRRDFSVKNGLNMWVVADNLRKGAATNAIQIMQALINKYPRG